MKSMGLRLVGIGLTMLALTFISYSLRSETTNRTSSCLLKIQYGAQAVTTVLPFNEQVRQIHSDHSMNCVERAKRKAVQLINQKCQVLGAPYYNIEITSGQEQMVFQSLGNTCAADSKQSLAWLF